MSPYAYMCIAFVCLTENLPGVLDVRFVEKPPAEKRCLLSWEQVWRNFSLPENILKTKL